MCEREGQGKRLPARDAGSRLRGGGKHWDRTEAGPVAAPGAGLAGSGLRQRRPHWELKERCEPLEKVASCSRLPWPPALLPKRAVVEVVASAWALQAAAPGSNAECRLRWETLYRVTPAPRVCRAAWRETPRGSGGHVWLPGSLERCWGTPSLTLRLPEGLGGQAWLNHTHRVVFLFSVHLLRC